MTNVWKLARYALAGWTPGGSKRCIVCGHRVWRYMPYRDGWRGAPALMRALDCVGSDPDHFECPHCGSHDRERHLFQYMQASGVLESINGGALLHFAPEKHLSRLIARSQPGQYVKADLFPGAPDVLRVDMLDMQFANDSFDMVIANHVLEHVASIERALSEIRRVLKQGGHAILQTPYSRMLHHTWEDSGIDSPHARLQAFGQEDHVRLFGRDIFNRFAAAGFESRVQSHAELLPDVDTHVAGVNPAEPFFLFRKR